MKIIRLLILLAAIHDVSNAQNKRNTDVPIMKFDQLEPLLHLQNDTFYLVNFWATWCIPCREEMPVLREISDKYAGQKFRLLLISLDFKKQVETQLKPFIVSQGIHSKVILLNDPDQNSWINKVDPKWSGALPFSLLYQGNYRQPFSRALHFEELDSIINLKLKRL